MKAEKELSINVAEKGEFQECGDEMDFWYHSYLMLLDESGETPHILQEIHFHPADFGKMLPNVRLRDKALNNDGNKITVFNYLSGNENEILHKWNHALTHAVKIKESTDIKFGLDYRHEPSSNNCRTGVKTMLETMGIKFRNEFTKSAAGTMANLGIKTDPLPGKELHSMSIEDLWHENEQLVRRLPPVPQSEISPEYKSRVLNFDFS